MPDDPQAELSRLASVIDKLVEENRRMAAALAEAESARDAALAAAEEKQRREAAATAAAEEERKTSREAQKRVTALERELKQLRARTPAADAETPPVITGERLGGLLEEFVGSLRSEVAGLDVQSGSLNLKVGLTETREGPAFVVPRADQPAERIGTLHNVNLSFDRVGLSVGRRDRVKE